MAVSLTVSIRVGRAPERDDFIGLMSYSVVGVNTGSLFDQGVFRPFVLNLNAPQSVYISDHCKVVLSGIVVKQTLTILDDLVSVVHISGHRDTQIIYINFMVLDLEESVVLMGCCLHLEPVALA